MYNEKKKNLPYQGLIKKTHRRHGMMVFKAFSVLPTVVFLYSLLWPVSNAATCLSLSQFITTNIFCKEKWLDWRTMERYMLLEVV
jgi:hypothetical protein